MGTTPKQPLNEYLLDVLEATCHKSRVVLVSSASASVHPHIRRMMRLQPIEEPKGFFLKSAYNYSKKRFGRVLTPLKTVHARVPSSLLVELAVGNMMDRGLSLDPYLVYLVKSIVANINGCSFCVDIAQAEALRSAGKKHRKNESSLESVKKTAFSDAELAAIAFAREASIERSVSDMTYTSLQEYFSDRQIAELTLVIAVEHYYNFTNIPLGIESDELCAIAQLELEEADEEA